MRCEKHSACSDGRHHEGSHKSHILLVSTFSAVGRHLTGLSTLCRGKDVRNMLLPALGHLAYPLERSLLPEQYVLKPGHTGRSYSMKCLSFTNTEGKTNPGDRVDMDVSILMMSASA